MEDAAYKLKANIFDAKGIISPCSLRQAGGNIRYIDIPAI